MTLHQAIELAVDDPAIRPLRLHQAIIAQPGVGPVVARRVIGRTLALLELKAVDTPHWKKVTVGWLLDGRSGGRRYLAWEEALLREKNGRRDLIRTSLVGFPFTSVEMVAVDLPKARRTPPASSVWDRDPRPAPAPAVPHDPWAAAPDIVTAPPPAARPVDPWAGAPR
jgi:hypothetical protein